MCLWSEFSQTYLDLNLIYLIDNLQIRHSNNRDLHAFKKLYFEIFLVMGSQKFSREQSVSQLEV